MVILNYCVFILHSENHLACFLNSVLEYRGLPLKIQAFLVKYILSFQMFHCNGNMNKYSMQYFLKTLTSHKEKCTFVLLIIFQVNFKHIQIWNLKNIFWGYLIFLFNVFYNIYTNFKML